jgi:hypothetical protein
LWYADAGRKTKKKLVAKMEVSVNGVYEPNYSPRRAHRAFRPRACFDRIRDFDPNGLVHIRLPADQGPRSA